MKKNVLQKISLITVLCTLYSVLSFSGCIRLTGGAGVWKQGAEDEEPTSHEVGFDTQQIVPQKNQANITT